MSAVDYDSKGNARPAYDPKDVLWTETEIEWRARHGMVQERMFSEFGGIAEMSTDDLWILDVVEGWPTLNADYSDLRARATQVRPEHATDD